MAKIKAHFFNKPCIGKDIRKMYCLYKVYNNNKNSIVGDL